MVQSDVAFRLLLVVLLIAVNGFFAGAEVALISVRSSRLKQLAEDGVAGAQAAMGLLANPQRLLSVTQVGVTLTSLGLGWAGEGTVYDLLSAAIRPAVSPANTRLLHGIAFGIAFLIISYLHVIFGEVVPKNLAIEKAHRLAVLVSPPLLLFYKISLPFVVVIEKSAAGLARALRLAPGHGAGGHSAEELKLIVSASGVLPEQQEEMIHRVLDLNQVSVREIMVPRNDIVSIAVDAPLEEVLKTMIEQQHSRLPVWEGKPEQIVGVLHYKDLLQVWVERRTAIRSGRPSRAFRVRSVMRRHMVVPETKPLSQMLQEFRLGRSHMAMVVDEFGTIVGLLTVEDVLEEIVGAIADEYDEAFAESPASEATELEVDGATRIRDLENQFAIQIPADAGFETLAGFLLYKLGDIPKPGDTVEFDGRRYTVLEMERNRIARVRVEKLQTAQPGVP
jgi:putative hemolysin